MDRYLSTADGSTLLNLGKVLSIIKPNNWNHSLGHNEVQTRNLEPGIYVEIRSEVYMRVLDVSDIEMASNLMDDRYRMNIIKGAIGDSGWFQVLLHYVMTLLRDQLLKDNVVIDMYKIVAEAMDKYCDMKESMAPRLQQPA